VRVADWRASGGRDLPAALTIPAHSQPLSRALPDLGHYNAPGGGRCTATRRDGFTAGRRRRRPARP
jgi:hypothetical protein